MHATRALTKVEFLLFLRNPTSVFMALLLPSLLLLLQAYVIPGTMDPIGPSSPSAPAWRAIDFFVPIAAAVAVTSVAITNYPSAIGAYRESGVLRRLGTTPVGAHRVLLAQWLVSAATLAVSILIALLLARFAFEAVAPRNPALAAASILMGTVTMMAVGSVIAAVAASAQIAYGMGLLIFMACLFTAGMWTPGPLMPEAIRAVSSFTPVGAMTQALTDAWYAGTGTWGPFLVMAVWAAAGGTLALRIFKWS
ncbi:ABC transporter permease [Microbacterium wangchenii]|uniref:ABC transporter permease n=1 Tax=Microbacterium wangchenii TaxID=2541726 RepID=UPI0011C7D60D|nr:ABC transporter permease [Microbacterium wangchenii]TXK14820.1 ABC transporter permease [Microbacterium wangchenii]